MNVGTGHGGIRCALAGLDLLAATTVVGSLALLMLAGLTGAQKLVASATGASESEIILDSKIQEIAYLSNTLGATGVGPLVAGLGGYAISQSCSLNGSILSGRIIIIGGRLSCIRPVK